MQDTFWTDERVKEYCEFLFGASGQYAEQRMEQFKSSKSPKKEWEIVAFKYLPNGYIITNTQTFGWDIALEGDKDYIIHSVRRLSDGEVFSVGDRILAGTIIKIEKTDKSCDGLLLRTGEWTTRITCAEKLRTPVLTTVDGVEIFSGQEYWATNLDGHVRSYIGGEQGRWPSANDKFFSTKEAAISYTLDYKPLLSLNDVKKVFGEHEVYIFPAVLEEKLTALVKQKLNQ